MHILNNKILINITIQLILIPKKFKGNIDTISNIVQKAKAK